MKMDQSYIFDFLYHGIAFYFQNKCTDAIKDLTRTIELGPSTERAYLYRAMSYYKTNEPEKAILDSYVLVQMKPEISVNYIRRG